MQSTFQNANGPVAGFTVVLSVVHDDPCVGELEHLHLLKGQASELNVFGVLRRIEGNIHLCGWQFFFP